MKALHRFLRDHLHGGADVAPPKGEDLLFCYGEYAGAVAKAHALLQRHGPGSAQFEQADIAGMRLFHRVKKMQGLGKRGRTPT